MRHRTARTAVRGSIGRAFALFGEQRLEGKIKQQVVAADVEEDRQRRPEQAAMYESSDGADANVRRRRAQSDARARQNLQVRPLVRNQVVGVEVTGQLRRAATLAANGAGAGGDAVSPRGAGRCASSRTEQRAERKRREEKSGKAADMAAARTRLGVKAHANPKPYTNPTNTRNPDGFCAIRQGTNV